MMKKSVILAVSVMMLLCACGNKAKQQNTPTIAEDSLKTDSTVAVVDAYEGSEVPPVLVSYVKGLPLFAPFNDGNILNGGKVLKQSPEKYTKLLLGDEVFDVNYKEEKNPDLKQDESYLNQYVYKIKDEMKGQLYDYADLKAVEKFMQTHGDMTAEGEIIVADYRDGILVSADYMQERTLIPFMDTTTEDPDEPRFPAAVVAQVEKMIGQKVEKSRIACVLGKDEYNFGVMRTKPNSDYGIAAWVLSKGNDVTIWTDTCEVVKEEGRIYWSSYDPDEYMEPHVLSVVKGSDGLDIYTYHMNTDEMSDYYLLRQEGSKFKRFSLGGFYQMYE